MKKQLHFLAVSLLLLAFSFSINAQTTRRVNGDPNITGVNVYNTIQAAVDAANTDDVILIEPYGKNQGENPAYSETVTVDKRLHFRGNGYNLTNPLLTTAPLDKRDVRIRIIRFVTGSGSSTISNLNITEFIEVLSPNIKIESSKANFIFTNSIENAAVIISEGVSLKIRKCIVSNNITDLRGNLSVTNSNLNLVAENTTISGNLASLDNSIFKNCHIAKINRVDNSIFTNCVFESAFDQSSNNSISYCISFVNDLPTLGNNINNAAWQQVYKGLSYGSPEFVGENDRVLSNPSIAKNAGINGGDIGVYGGTYPYELSGLPHHPISTFFINSGIGNNAIDIDAVITIKAN